MSKFCSLPFQYLFISPIGNYAVCPYFENKDKVFNIKDSSLSEWVNSNTMIKIRKEFSNNIMPLGCKKCRDLEEQGFESQRIKANKLHKVFEKYLDLTTTIPINVEISVGNVCNLKCVMCNEESSSSFLAENKILGINILNQKDFDWWKISSQNLTEILSKNLKFLQIRGGEPFFSNDLITILDKINLDQVLLHVTTNGTTWNTQWESILKKFKLVKMQYSIDSTGKVNDYIRFPSNWNIIRNNIKKINNMPNVHSVVQCTVQNINVAYLNSLVDFCEKENMTLMLNILTDPKIFKFTNLLDNDRRNAIKSLNDIISKNPNCVNIEDLIVIKDALEKSPIDYILWNQFLQQIELRDSYRGNSWKSLLLGK